MKPRSPRSYDEITRRTVPEPDSSFRPAREDEGGAASDQELRERVADALIAMGFPEVGIEVDHGRVTLRGWVRDLATASRIERIVAVTAPEARVDNRLHLTH